MLRMTVGLLVAGTALGKYQKEQHKYMKKAEKYGHVEVAPEVDYHVHEPIYKNKDVYMEEPKYESEDKKEIYKPNNEKKHTVYEPVHQDIVDTIIESGRFKKLLVALEAADLVDELRGEGPLTVFAPTDRAFSKLGKDLYELLKPENKDLLVEILGYHVIPDKVTLKKEPLVTLQGDSIILRSHGPFRVDRVKVIKSDIKTKNGVIHVIDSVLMPPADEGYNHPLYKKHYKPVDLKKGYEPEPVEYEENPYEKEDKDLYHKRKGHRYGRKVRRKKTKSKWSNKSKYVEDEPVHKPTKKHYKPKKVYEKEEHVEEPVKKEYIPVYGDEDEEYEHDEYPEPEEYDDDYDSEDDYAEDEYVDEIIYKEQYEKKDVKKDVYDEHYDDDKYPSPKDDYEKYEEEVKKYL